MQICSHSSSMSCTLEPCTSPFNDASVCVCLMPMSCEPKEMKGLDRWHDIHWASFFFEGLASLVFAVLTWKDLSSSLFEQHYAFGQGSGDIYKKCWLNIFFLQFNYFMYEECSINIFFRFWFNIFSNLILIIKRSIF